ncbi:MAG: hypothetical protein ACE5ID_04625 [Acidobacteriota bacterium]
MSAGRAGGLRAYPAFLCSLLLPGLGQVLAGAVARGLLLMALAVFCSLAILLAWGSVLLASTMPPGALLPAALALLVWGFAAYDAWFLVRERDNGMLPFLPRTPRVAAFLDLLWGGIGHLYLGRSGSILLCLLTLGGLSLWGYTGRSGILALLALWNGTLALGSHLHAGRLFHHTPGYAQCKARLESAPMDSMLAPAPGLPLATLVAVSILWVGGLALYSPTGSPQGIPTTTGTLLQGGFQDPAHRFALDLPASPWVFRAGPSPWTLTGRLVSMDESFTLSILPVRWKAGGTRPSARDDLARMVETQVARMAREFPGFQIISRTPVDSPSFPGWRILFKATRPGNPPQILARSYHACNGGLLVLTLAHTAVLSAEHLAAELDRITSTLKPIDGTIE